MKPMTRRAFMKTSTNKESRLAHERCNLLDGKAIAETEQGSL